MSLTWLLIAWAVVTAIFAGLLIYRSLIAMKEDDQLFLDPAENKLEEEQRRILARLNHLAPYTKGFGVASAALLVLMAGLWIYGGLTGFAGAEIR